MNIPFLIFILSLAITVIVSFTYVIWLRRRDEQKLISIIHSSPIPTFVISKDHKVMYWNRALQALSGIRPREIVGTNQHWRIFYKAERPCLADLILDNKVEQIADFYSVTGRNQTCWRKRIRLRNFSPNWAIRENGFVLRRRRSEIPTVIYSARWKRWKILLNKK